MDLRKIRKKIDLLDKKIVDILSQRVNLALEVARIKKKENKSFYSPDREFHILKRLEKINPGVIPLEYLQDLFSQIMSLSFALSGNFKVAYLGPVATFTHLAAIKKFGKNTEFIPCIGIDEVFFNVSKQKAKYGVVPVENSIEGAVNYTLDMFVDSDLKICAEIILEITHSLMVNKNVRSFKGIKNIYSHPQVFSQCRKWLQDNFPRAEFVPCSTTSRAAELAKKNRHSACIGSKAVASVYGLKVLAENIEDKPFNITRFLVIAKEDALPTGNDKTSLIFSVKDRVGALYDALYAFRKNRVNLTKIESRPSKKKAWDYYFFVDLEGHRNVVKVKQALKSLEKRAQFVKILGSYPRVK